MSPTLHCVLLLAISNTFMTLAWYGHLKHMKTSHWLAAALVSWGIALFEYLFQVPANRAGHQVMSIPQLKILQEVIALSVFVPISVFLLNEKVKMDYLYACLCMVGAVYFVFRSKG